MINNNDKLLAQQFDNHLKNVMHQLAQDVNKDTNKNLVIMRAKQSLLELLLSKIVEYVKTIDTNETGKVFTDIYKQF